MKQAEEPSDEDLDREELSQEEGEEEEPVVEDDSSDECWGEWNPAGKLPLHRPRPPAGEPPCNRLLPLCDRLPHPTRPPPQPPLMRARAVSKKQGRVEEKEEEEEVAPAKRAKARVICLMC